MMGEVVRLHKDSGARGAVRRVVSWRNLWYIMRPWGFMPREDRVLAMLWIEGYMVVPVPPVEDDGKGNRAA